MNPLLPHGDPDRYGSLPVPAGQNGNIRVSAPPAFLSSGPETQHLLHALERRWPLALFGGLAVGATAVVVAFFLVPPAKYTVRAMIHIASNPVRIIFQTSESVPDYRSYQRTQATLAKSRKVLNAALRLPGVGSLHTLPTDGDRANWLDRELKVDFPGGAEIMTMTMVGTDAADATTLVNAACDAYLKQIVEEERRDRVVRYDSLKKLFNKLQDELREKRKMYRVSVEDVGVTDKLSVAVRQQTTSQNLGHLQVELSQLQTEIRQMQRRAKLSAARQDEPTADSAPSADALADDAVARDPEIAQMRKTGERLKQEVARLARLNRDLSDPSIQQARDRLTANERAVRNRSNEVRATAMRSMTRDRQVQGDEKQAELTQVLAILTEQEVALREQVLSLTADLKSGNVKALDMNWLDDEIALTSQSAKTVGSEVEALNVELTAQPRIRLIERAEAPILSDPMRRSKLCGGAGVACFALFAGAVVFLEARTRRVGSSEEIAHGLGIRLIGSIPARPRRRQIRKAGDAWQQMLIESVDAARTLILHASRQDPLNVIMVASAVKGEGKTTLACLLSASLLRAGKRTLLIDGDLRCPSLHRLMDIVPGAGLCELLRGDANLDDAIISAAGPGVDFLPAGQSDSDALQGLADGRFAVLLDGLRGRYDQIVIDSAPVLYVPDGPMIAQHVDAVVLAVLRNVSQAPKVYAAHERLTDVGARVLGAIVGGTRGEESRGYAYQYAQGKLGGRS